MAQSVSRLSINHQENIGSSYTGEIVKLHSNAIDEVFGEIAGAFHNGSIDKLLKVKVALSGFVRLTK